MTNFDELLAHGGTFTPTSSHEFDEYQQWAAEQSCGGCGWRAKDRSRLPSDRWWVTETECGYCFEIRCLRKQLRDVLEVTL